MSASLNSGTEKVCIIERGGESIKVSVEKILSHSAENFRRGILMCCVSEKFRQRKSLCKRGWGSKKIFVEIFCLTVPKKVVGETFSFSLNARIERLYASQ